MPKSRGGRALMLVIGIAVGVIVTVGVIYALNPNAVLPPSTPPASPTFSLTVRDPLENVALEESDFDAKLYGLNIGEDPSVSGSWEELSGVADLGDISAADFDDDLYSDYYVTYNGTVLETFFDDHDGTRTYGERQAHVDHTGPNTLLAYATPSAGGSFVVVYASNGTVINTATKNITTANNFTIFANSVPLSEIMMAYASYTTRVGDLVAINFLVTFNDTVALGDISASGLDKEAATTTSIVFSYSYQGTTTKTFNFIWSDDAIAAAALEIDGPIVMRFGTAVI